MFKIFLFACFYMETFKTIQKFPKIPKVVSRVFIQGEFDAPNKNLLVTI